MRDRLIELLKQIDFDYGEECVCASEDGYKGAPDLAEFFADRLLAEGVIVLPCRLGKEVYDITEFVEQCPCPELYEFSTDDITLSRCRRTKELIFGIDGIDYTFDEFGKRVFLTEEEAYEKLRELERSEE